MRSAPNALTSHGGTDTPAEAEERVQAATSAAAGEKGRVLLVEDDASFRETIYDFLTENGYQVVAARNGTEGVKEALAGDFALILCDMMMPGLPGEMFYRAVERVRPRMGERFVFMTGYRGDQKTNDFIGSINGYVLQKPFPLQHVLDSIAFAEVRRNFVSVFDTASIAPGSTQVIPPTNPYLTRIATFRPEPSVAEEVSEPARCDRAAPEQLLRSSEPERRRGESGIRAPHAPTAPAPQQLSSTRRVAEPPSRPSLGRMRILTGLALFIALAVSLCIRVPRARGRATAAAADHRALEAEWKVISAQQQEAGKARNASAELRERVKRLAEECKTDGWTDALRVITSVAGTGIELRTIAARGLEGPRGGCKILIRGIATGGTPRVIANNFHDALRRAATERFTGAVVTQLTSLEDESEIPSAASNQRRASFKITVSIAANENWKKESGAAK